MLPRICSLSQVLLLLVFVHKVEVVRGNSVICRLSLHFVITFMHGYLLILRFTFVLWLGSGSGMNQIQDLGILTVTLLFIAWIRCVGSVLLAYVEKVIDGHGHDRGRTEMLFIRLMQTLSGCLRLILVSWPHCRIVWSGLLHFLVFFLVNYYFIELLGNGLRKRLGSRLGQIGV